MAMVARVVGDARDRLEDLLRLVQASELARMVLEDALRARKGVKP